MIGVIIPHDRVANQAATILCGNPLLQRVIEHCQADIKEMLHHLTTLLRLVIMFLLFENNVNSELLKRDGFQLDYTRIC